MLRLLQGGQPGLDLKTRSLTKLNVPGLLQQKQGPEDQSEGQIVDSEGDPADAGIPILDSLKMTEEEQRDYDAFSLASVLMTKRHWRAQEDLNASKPQPQNISLTHQARPVTCQAVAKAQSVKSAQSDLRSVS